MIQFGTGGWRDIIADNFTKSNLQLLAKAMADKMKAEHVDEEGMVIGYDRRFLSKESMQWMAEVLAYEGIVTHLINHSGPTPLVMYYVMAHHLHYGMMVTASHNLAIYNGVKVFTYGGRDASQEQTRDIERYIEAVPPDSVRAMRYDDAKAKGFIVEFYPINEYLDSILGKINVQAIRDAQLKVVLDPMYGVSETPIKTILLTARCDMITIHGGHDTLFGGKMPAPSREAMGELIVTLKDKGCDIGLATDGDADRIGVVDDRGNYLSANDILVLLYYYLVKYRGERGPAVRNLCTTERLDRIAEAFGQKCYEVPVGFKHISSKMMETDALIGGESSGGMSVRGHINGKDGVYSAALLVEMIAVTGLKISEIMEDIGSRFGRTFTVEDNYRFLPEQRETFTRLLLEDKKLPDMPYPVDKVSYMDGCKVHFENGGWVVARFSGTEPLLRVFSEMPAQADADNICSIFREFLGL